MKKASEGPMKGILGLYRGPRCSSDFRGDTQQLDFRRPVTMMLGDKFAKVVSWYDNEWAYSERVGDLIDLMVKKGCEFDNVRGVGRSIRSPGCWHSSV